MLKAEDQVELTKVNGLQVEQRTRSEYRVFLSVGGPVVRYSNCHKRPSAIQFEGHLDVLPPFSSAAWYYDRQATLLIGTLPVSYVQTAEASLDVRLSSHTVRPLFLVRDACVENVVRAMFDAERIRGNARNVYLKSLALGLAMQLVRLYAQGSSGLRCSINEDITRVLEHIGAHLAEKLSIRELAGVANVSESYLKGEFKKATGLPVHEFIMKTRVNFALDELSRGVLPLSEVAGQAGFADQSHMTRWIKRIAGVAPRAYRHSGL